MLKKAGLGRYIEENPRVIRLQWAFLSSLLRCALDGDQIPILRRRDWLARNNTFVNNQPFAMGQLIRDHRIHSTHSITVEIKPKSGYVSRSPLVNPSRKFKLLYSRYSLMQQLLQTRNVTKNWMDSDVDDC